MLKNFATSSRLVRDTKKFSRHSRDTRTNVVRKSHDKIRKTVARNSHASEILVLRIKLQWGIQINTYNTTKLYEKRLQSV